MILMYVCMYVCMHVSMHAVIVCMYRRTIERGWGWGWEGLVAALECWVQYTTKRRHRKKGIVHPLFGVYLPAFGVFLRQRGEPLPFTFLPPWLVGSFELQQYIILLTQSYLRGTRLNTMHGLCTYNQYNSILLLRCLKVCTTGTSFLVFFYCFSGVPAWRVM